MGEKLRKETRWGPHVSEWIEEMYQGYFRPYVNTETFSGSKRIKDGSKQIKDIYNGMVQSMEEF